MERSARRDESAGHVGANSVPIFVNQLRADVSPPNAAPSAATDSVAPPERQLPTSEELGLLYANAFDEEPVDPAWAMQAQRTLGREIEAHRPQGSSVLGLECRSRFCRLEIVHDSIEVANEMLMDLFMLHRNGPFSRTDQGFRQVDPVPTVDNKQRFTVYISGPGVPIALDLGS